MRHGKKFNHLGRQASHRAAMLSNMSCSIIEHKRIKTTVAKAKAVKKYLEPLLTKAKTDSTHSRRTVFSYLNNKEAVTELYREIAPKIADRPGGYLRIIRLTETRLGDNAEMCMIELVDFNEIYTKAKSAAKKSRSRRSAGATKKVAAPAAEATATAVEEAPEAPVAEAPEAPAAEDNTEETQNDKTEE